MQPDTGVPAQEKKEEAPTDKPTNPPADQESQPADQPKPKGEDKPVIAYRIEPSRSFEINKQHSERPARARTLAILRSSLFGRKRYQEIHLNCSLNNLFNALRIARFLHLRVPDLSLTIRFIPIKIVEVFTDGNRRESHQVTDKKRVEIKLTTSPTEQDKLQPGFNPGFPQAEINDPILGLNLRNNGERPDRRKEQRDDKKDGNRNEQRRKERKPKNEKKVEGRGQGQGEGRGNRQDRRRDEREGRGGNDDRRNKRDEEARRHRNRDEQNENTTQPRKYRQANYEQLEDEEDYRRDRPNDGRNENRTDGKRTRGGPHSKASGGRERVQHEHDYQSSHLTRNLNDRQ